MADLASTASLLSKSSRSRWALCAGAGLGLALLWRQLRSRLQHFRRVPGWPVLGVLPYLRGGKALAECLEKWAEEYGDEGVFEVYMFSQRFVVCCSPKALQQIWGQRPFKVTRGKSIARTTELMDGVFTAEGQKWKVHRRLTAPAFNLANTQGYFPYVRSMVDAMVETISKLGKHGKEPVNFSKVLPCFSADIICNVAFGQDLGALRHVERMELGEAVDDANSGQSSVELVERFFGVALARVLAPCEWWKVPFLGRFEKGQALKDDFTKLMLQFMKDNHKKDTVLSKLMQAEGEKLTHEGLIGNMITLFLAGTDTTSGTLMWTMYYLAQQPHLQEQLFFELSSKAPSGLSSLEQIEELHLLRAIWTETLRRRSVTPFLLFAAAEPFELAGREVPVGTEIITLTRFAQDRMPEMQALGKDSDAFRPERWLQDGIFTKPDALDPLAFGHGSRACLGRRLADLEGQLAIATVVQHFKLSGGPNSVGEETNFTQAPDKDIKLTATPRSKVTAAMGGC